MKYLIVVMFLLSLTLNASDDMLDDIVFEETNDPSIMNLPDATVIELDSTKDQQQTPVSSTDTIIKEVEKTPQKTIKIKKPRVEIKEIIQPKPTNSANFIILESKNETKKKDIEEKVNFITPTITPISKPKTQIKKAKPITKSTKPKVKVKYKPKTKPIMIVKHIPNRPKPKTHNFWELLELTLTNSTKLVLKAHDIQITQENLKLIQSEYYPNLSLRYSSEYYNGYDRASSATIGGSFYPGYSQYRDSLSFNMDYELYRFGATGLKMKITQKEIDIIKSELDLAKEQVSLELLEYYTQALRAQKQITYKEQIKRIQDKIVQKKWRLFEAGQLSKTELSQDQKSLTTLEKEILTYKLRFIEAVKNIQALANISISDGNRFAMLEPKKIEVKSFEQSALAKNLNLQLQKKKQELELIKKDYLPTLYANSGYRFYGSDDNNFLKAIKNMRKNSWDVGIGLKWDIFNGYKTDATVQKLQLEINKLTEQYRFAKFEFETKNRKRELLKQSLDKVLQTETDLLSQTDRQEDMLLRLQRAGQTPSIQLDHIDINKLQSELNFKLSVIEHAKATVSGELIN